MAQTALKIGSITFPILDPGQRLAMLEPPADDARRAVIMDTDTYTEVDDQFALAYALLSPQKIDLQAVHAAPFFNKRSTGPADGMEKSYQEILRVFDRLGRPHDGLVYRGSTQYLPGPDQPVDSDAARNLVQRALDHEGRSPLYVLAIGAPTNISSAILMEPRIVERIVVVWLGGHEHHYPGAGEFNLKQDPYASRVLLDSGVPLVQIPCRNIAEQLRVTLPELNAHIKGTSRIGDYLTETVAGYSDDHYAWSKVIWDIVVVAWMIDPSWVWTDITHSPRLTSELTWSVDRRRHLIRVGTRVIRDRVYADLFRKIADADN